jgi:hypothetical protein
MQFGLSYKVASIYLNFIAFYTCLGVFFGALYSIWNL